jgi:hypothetical protein
MSRPRNSLPEFRLSITLGDRFERSKSRLDAPIRSSSDLGTGAFQCRDEPIVEPPGVDLQTDVRVLPIDRGAAPVGDRLTARQRAGELDIDTHTLGGRERPILRDRHRQRIMQPTAVDARIGNGGIQHRS